MRHIRAIFTIGLIVVFLALSWPHPSSAQDALPGDACAVQGRFMRSGGPELAGSSHFLICSGGTWQSAISFTSTANLATIGNLTCNPGELLNFDGTKWVCGTASGSGGGGASNPFAFRVHRNGSDFGGTANPVNWTTEAFDTDNAFNLSNDRFQPTEAGYYYFNFQVIANDCEDAGIEIYIMKNGTDPANAMGDYSSGDRASVNLYASVSALIYLDGVSDYVTVAAYENCDEEFFGDEESSFFQGYKVGAGGGSGDDLGNHTATQDIDAAAHKIVNATSIQLSNDTDPCTSAKGGAIRYTSGGDPPWEYCDGGATSWLPFRQPRCQDDDTGECYLDADRSDDDPDFTAANIADGVNILGVTGTYTGGGCTAPASCTSVGDVCSDGSLFAGFMLYNGSCEPLYVTDNNQSTYSQWKAPPPFAPPFSGNDIPNPVDQYDAVDGQYNRDNRGSGSFPAFELCENNTYHGKSDWYLPARGELNLLWLNRAAISANAAGDFDGLHYWSSTEPIAAAWVQYFMENGFGNHGEQFYDDKDAYYAVRCVRRD